MKKAKKGMLPKDFVDGLTIGIPGAGQAVYHKDAKGHDSLVLTPAQRDIIRRAMHAYHAAYRAAADAADKLAKAELAEALADGYQAEPLIEGGVIYTRDCRRPDGTESGIGETYTPCDSREYRQAYAAAYAAALETLEDRHLAEWYVETGASRLIGDMLYRGHTF